MELRATADLVETTEEGEELRMTADLEPTTKKVELKVTVDLEPTTEEVELKVTVELEPTTEEEMKLRAMEVTTEELRADQQVLLMWISQTQRS